MTVPTRHAAQLTRTQAEQFGTTPSLFRAVLGEGEWLVRPVFNMIENASAKWHSTFAPLLLKIENFRPIQKIMIGFLGNWLVYDDISRPE